MDRSVERVATSNQSASPSPPNPQYAAKDMENVGENLIETNELSESDRSEITELQESVISKKRRLENDETRDDLLRSIKISIDTTRRENRRLRKTIDRLNSVLENSKVLSSSTPPSTPVANQTSSSTEALYWKGIDLKLVSGHDAGKYAVNLAKKIFTREQIKDCMSSPQKNDSLRRPFPAEEMSVIKKAVLLYFPNKWPEARESINQLGRDYKRRDLQSAMPNAQWNP